MNDLCNYCLQVAGHVDEDELNALSPLEMKIERSEVDSTWLSILTDQSGLIGVLRHLHGLGIVFISLNCKTDSPTHFTN